MKCICVTILVLSLIFLGSCADRGNAVTSKLLARFPEMQTKEKLQAASSDQLELLPILRSTGKTSVTAFVLPTSIGYSSAGDLFISDNNGQTIHRWAVNTDRPTVFLANNAIGLLEFPNGIQSVGGQVFVADNAGIKVFSAEGQLERLIRTYFTVFSFVVTPRNTIFINPIIRNAGAQDPLIIELDNQGRRIRGFGLRRNTNNNMFDDRAFLTLGQGKLFVGFKYSRTVEVYDVDSGRLIDSINIDHEVLNQLPHLNVRSATSGAEEKLAQLRYIAGVKSVQDKLFVCLHLPQPEILEFDQNGRAVAHFRVPVRTPAIDIFGFEARDTGKHKRMAIGIVEPDWSSNIYEVAAP